MLTQYHVLVHFQEKDVSQTDDAYCRTVFAKIALFSLWPILDESLLTG